jgi:hypothetical protein
MPPPSPIPAISRPLSLNAVSVGAIGWFVTVDGRSGRQI